MRLIFKSFLIFLFLFVFYSPLYAKVTNAQFVTVKLHKYRPLKNQLKKENTIYVINKKINLKGQTIIIPENSTLHFTGNGKMYNGTLIGNKTRIIADPYLVLENVEIGRKGSWNNEYGYPEWFGASNQPTNDSKLAIQKAIDVSDTCVLSQAYYTAYDTKTFRGDDVSFCAIDIENKAIKGLRGSKILIDSRFSNTERTTVFYVGSNVLFDGVNIEYYHEDHSGWTGTQSGVYRIHGSNVTIENTSLKGAMAAWINIIGAPGREGYIIRNNYIHDCDCGVILQGNQHADGEIYSIKLLIENNVIEKEKEPHSEFVSFWGSCKDGGRVYYTDVSIINNYFSGGYLGGCISGHPQRCGLKDVMIVGNIFNDCGACSFYNTKGLVYLHNFVAGSTFISRQSKGILGSYPDLAFYNCSDCYVDDSSCFGLIIRECEGMRIGKLKQTLNMSHSDSLLLKGNDYVTNFIGIAAYNTTLSIDELIINPFVDSSANSDICRYLIHRGYGSTINVGKIVSSIPIQVSKNRLNVDELVFVPGNTNLFYIETTRQ